MDDGPDEFCVLSSRLLFTYQDNSTLLTMSEFPLLAMYRVQKAQAFATVHLLQPTGRRIFVLSFKTKKEVLLHQVTSLRREGYVMSVA